MALAQALADQLLQAKTELADLRGEQMLHVQDLEHLKALVGDYVKHAVDERGMPKATFTDLQKFWQRHWGA